MIIFETATTPPNSSNTLIPLQGSSSIFYYTSNNTPVYISHFSLYFGSGGVTIPSGEYIIIKLIQKYKNTNYTKEIDELIVTQDIHKTRNIYLPLEQNDCIGCTFTTSSSWPNIPIIVFVNNWVLDYDTAKWQYGNCPAPDMT